MKTAGSRQIAERYVKALFDTAGAGKNRDAVEKDLGRLARILVESEEMRDLLANPLMSRNQQGKAMASILDAIKAHDITHRFIHMLAKQKRLPILPDIAAIFAQWAMEARGEMKAEVVSAAPLSLKDVAVITEELSKAIGKKVTLEVSEDKNLLGGVVIKIGSQQLDSSLAGKLDRLKQQLKAA